ncbi:MAG: AAA family ATPase [Luteolibacter sp.]
MNANAQANLCRAYLYAATPDASRSGQRGQTHGPVVTISRQAGARGNSIAKALVPELNASDFIPKKRPWTVFNQNLLDHCIREHDLPEKTADYFPEDKPEEIRSLVGEILGLHAGVFTNARKVAETIRRLSQAGNSIIVGRGGNLVAADVKHAIHVRFVGDSKIRARHFAKLHSLTLEAAEQEIAKRDRARKRYIKSTFDREIGDPCQYDLIINTDRFSNEAIARAIRLVLEEKFR